MILKSTMIAFFMELCVTPPHRPIILNSHMARRSKETHIFMQTHWARIEDGQLVVGINEDGINEIANITKVHCADDTSEVEADEIVVEIETDDGPFNVYTPISGTVAEVNPAFKENNDIIFEDCLGEGWLFKIDASDESELDEFLNGNHNNE